VAPFAKTGGLADVSASLPKALQAHGHDVAVVMPLYSGIVPDDGPLWTIDVPVPFGSPGCAVYRKWLAPDLPVYLIDHRAYYQREVLYGNIGGGYWDNAGRFAYFCRATCELARLHLPEMDVMHANDWQTAMISVFLRTHYANESRFFDTGTVLTIHNMGYQGLFGTDAFPVLGLGWEYFSPDSLEYKGSVNFLKGGIIFSDVITTVSPRYAFEIQTPEGGYGLDGLLRKRGADVVGILNGVDYAEWNPATDGHIAATYSPEDLSGKRECKRALLREFGMDPEYSGPVIGMVSRLADQKGLDLVASTIYRLMELDCALVLLGTGDPKYEHLFQAIAARHPEKIGLRIGYDNGMAHRIEAGADMFLMPSRYEPCGLNQIYSLKYGTVPIVRAIGGLDDTIEDFNGTEDSGTGFKFHGYSGDELFDAIVRAVTAYQDGEQWKRLQHRGMSRDFSWDRSARQYEGVYRRARSQHALFVPHH